MSPATQEADICERVEERPSLQLGEAAEVRPRDLGYRLMAGAATSVAAGVVTLVFGARAGGLLLAFPAILAASLTLIEEQEDSEEAREDARGAVVGGVALAVFAAIAALTFGPMGAALALLLATAGWVITAITGYVILWWR